MKSKKLFRQKRKNLLTLFIILVCWGLLSALVYFVNPATFGIIPIFFLILFVALFFTFSIVLVNTRRGFLVSLAITFYLFLRFLGVGNIINLLLIIGLTITVDFYFTKNT